MRQNVIIFDFYRFVGENDMKMVRGKFAEKLIAVFIAIVSLFAVLSVGVCAEENETFADAWELYGSWDGKLPESVAGVWLSEDGSKSITFALAGEGADECREAILAQITDEDSVRFIEFKYTTAELNASASEIEKSIELNIGIVDVQINERQNRIDITVLAEKVNNKGTQTQVETYSKKYGDMVYVNYSGDIFKQTIIAGSNSFSDNDQKLGGARFFIIFVCVIIAALACGYMVILKKRGNLLENVNQAKIDDVKNEHESEQTETDAEAEADTEAESSDAEEKTE